MVHWVETTVRSAAAQRLLAEYFAERAAGFPPEQGVYRATLPAPEQFVPPAGQFLLVVPGAPAKHGGPDESAGAAGARAAAGADDAEAVGCGGIRRIQRAESGLVRFEVKHLFLQPAVRGLGYGGMLLAELERRAAHLGADEIVLDTNASLESAGELYRRAGYRGIDAYNDNPNATNWYGKRLGP